MRPVSTGSPIASGTLLALFSALLFGASTPAVQRLGRGLGPFTTAALLYAGAAAVALAALAVRRGAREAPLRRRHLPRLLAVAASGAVLAPVALAWGLARSSGVAASLLLNLEAVFTIALGVILHHEHVGRRVVAAAAVMTAGGAVLLFAQPHAGAVELWGLAAVALATFGWSLDNALGALSPISIRPRWSPPRDPSAPRSPSVSRSSRPSPRPPSARRSACSPWARSATASACAFTWPRSASSAQAARPRCTRWRRSRVLWWRASPASRSAASPWSPAARSWCWAWCST